MGCSAHPWDASVILVANLQIKDLPEPVHAELRRRARIAGVTVRSYVTELIVADQRTPPASEWFARIERRRPVTVDSPVAELVAADREARADRS